jgi:membrane-associated HD superfamily phosphohydrolase
MKKIFGVLASGFLFVVSAILPAEAKEAVSLENGKPLLIFLWLIAPTICIFAVSITNQLSNTKTRRKLLVFYGSIIISVVFGAIIGLLFGKIAGMFAGVFTGLFAGAVAGAFAVDGDGGLGLLAGALAGVLTGGFAGALAGAQGYEIALQYLVFLVAVCAAGLAFIHIAALVKKQLPAIREWLGG